MKILKYLFAFCSILFLVNVVSAEGFFDAVGSYNYYVNNPSPTVDVTIKLPKENLIITDATLLIDDELKELDFPDEKIFAGSEDYTKSIALSEFGIDSITGENEIFFTLNVIKESTMTKIKVKGEPTKFNIIFDEEIPSISVPSANEIYLTEDADSLDILFSEKVAKIRIVGGNGFDKTLPDAFFMLENDYDDNLRYDFLPGELVEGENNFKITYEDFAGNTNEKDLRIMYRGEDLKIKLLTRKDDKNLKYFYDKDYSDFFDGKVQYSEDSYDLVIETNKASKCYFSSGFLEFKRFETLIDNSAIKEFTSSAGDTKHTYKMNSESAIWVACQNKQFTDDVDYLNNAIGQYNSLVKFSKYKGSLEISKFFPEAVVSSVPFAVSLVTTQKAICKYKFDSGEMTDFSNNGSHMSHVKSGLEFEDGNYKISVECFDRLYNVKSDSKTVEIDTQSGPKILGDMNFYTDSKTRPIVLKFSEDTECRYSSLQKTAADFNNLTILSGTGLEKSLVPSNLEIGDNTYYVYCPKDGQIFTNEINIIFDSTAPKLSNLSFVANGIKSDYLVDMDEINYDVVYSSRIPVDKYFVEVSYGNYSIQKNLTSSNGAFNENVEGAKKFKISAINVLGKKTNSLEKSIKFDFNEPILAFVNLGTERKITCLDAESGCKEVLYGFSQTAINCITSLKYNSSSTIKVNDNLYICAKGVDYVGNEKVIQQVLSTGFVEDIIEDNETTSGNGDDEPVEEDPVEEEPVEDNPFEPSNAPDEDNSSGNGLIIAAAVILLLGSIGGGGYYTYKEGYLDNQLEKFGIFRGAKKNGGKQQVMQKSTVPKTNVASKPATSTGFKPSAGVVKNNSKKVDTKTGYDRNLRKLNSFIDESLNKGDDVFGKFDSVDKGKVKNYEDTLIKKKADSGKKDSRKKFQEFSMSKSSSGKLNDVNSIEMQAEEFENYFKDKKDPKEKGSSKKEK